MAVHRAIGTRDPYSYPRYECDDNFAGKKSFQVKSNIHIIFSFNIILWTMVYFKKKVKAIDNFDFKNIIWTMFGRGIKSFYYY